MALKVRWASCAVRTFNTACCIAEIKAPAIYFLEHTDALSWCHGCSWHSSNTSTLIVLKVSNTWIAQIWALERLTEWSCWIESTFAVCEIVRLECTVSGTNCSRDVILSIARKTTNSWHVITTCSRLYIIWLMFIRYKAYWCAKLWAINLSFCCLHNCLLLFVKLCWVNSGCRILILVLNVVLALHLTSTWLKVAECAIWHISILTTTVNSRWHKTPIQWWRHSLILNEAEILIRILWLSSSSLTLLLRYHFTARCLISIKLW